jgi:hypothetical protein
LGKLYKETLTLIRPVDYCVFRNFNCLAHLHDRVTAFLNQDQRTISPPLPPSSAIGSVLFSIQDISCSSRNSIRLDIFLLPFLHSASICCAAASTPAIHFRPLDPVNYANANMKDCPTCKGNGTTKCDACNGKGCPACKRSGSNKCSVCEGTGAIHTEH